MSAARFDGCDVDNGGPEVQLVQAYNAVGSRTSLATGWDDGGGFDDDFQNVFTYDNLQRLTRVDQIGVMGGNTVAEKRVDFAYNAAGQFTSLTRYKDTDGGGTHLVATTTYGYDDIGRLTDLTHTHDTTSIADYDWTFDAYSRITNLSFTSLVGNDGDSDYTYDDTGQLIDADHDYQTDESYTYDENGNRTLTGYTTGDNNLLSTDGTYNYSYDDEGNRVLKTNISTGDYTEYTWDHRNRLVAITQKDSSHNVTHEVEYIYDVFNRRIEKSIDWDGAGGGSADIVQYLYDNDDIILAFDGSDALTNRYLHGPMVDQVLADEDATGDVIWPLADNLGSIRDIVENDGTVANHITYDAYGNITSETATSVDYIYAYTGRERDEESDLQFNRRRYYGTDIGQWLSEDPIGFRAGDSNIRRYVFNSPTIYTDPSGLANFWNPFTWDHAGAFDETWADFFNPASEANIATLGGLGEGAADGAAMVANAATLHQNEALNDHVNEKIAEHANPYGGPSLYDAGNVAGHIGVGAAAGAGIAGAAAGAGALGTQLGVASATGGGSGLGLSLAGGGAAGSSVAITASSAAVVPGTTCALASGTLVAGTTVIGTTHVLSNAAELRPYGGPGGGHHVPAKSAFEGASGYSPNEALAIPNAELARLGVSHPTVTGAQAQLYRAFSQTGQPLTWEAIEAVETQALVRGGMSAEQAAATVQRAIQALIDAGVSGPTRIPWGG